MKATLWTSLTSAVMALSVLTAPPTSAAERTPPMARAADPSVSNIAFETKLIKRESSLFEEQDFETELTATILPAPQGAALGLSGIQVYFRGHRITSGQRSYDARTGRFKLVLSSEEHMALLSGIEVDLQESGEAPAEPVLLIVVRDGADREGRGIFDPPPPEAVESSFQVGFRDEAGRFVPRGEAPEALPPARPIGRPVSLVPTTFEPVAPLQLRLTHQWPFPVSDRAATTGQLAPAPQGRVSVTVLGSYGTTMMVLAPRTGSLVVTETVHATPKGTVWEAYREGDRLFTLAFRRGNRFFVQEPTSHRRVVLPTETGWSSRDDFVQHFWADERRVVFSFAHFGVEIIACDWSGNETWRVSPWELFPQTQIANHTYASSLGPLADGSSMAFMAGIDNDQPDEPIFGGLARVSAEGKVLSSRILYLPPSPPSSVQFLGGAGVVYRGHQLMIMSLERYTNETSTGHTLVFDMESSSSEPIAVVPYEVGDGFQVSGAVVADGHLVVGCGTAGIAVFSDVGRTRGDEEREAR